MWIILFILWNQPSLLFTLGVNKTQPWSTRPYAIDIIVAIFDARFLCVYNFFSARLYHFSLLPAFTSIFWSHYFQLSSLVVDHSSSRSYLGLFILHYFSLPTLYFYLSTMLCRCTWYVQTRKDVFFQPQKILTVGQTELLRTCSLCCKKK